MLPAQLKMGQKTHCKQPQMKCHVSTSCSLLYRIPLEINAAQGVAVFINHITEIYLHCQYERDYFLPSVLSN